MDVDERFQIVLQGCRWVKDAGSAARLVPALAREAPAFVMLPWTDGEVQASVPVVCFSMLAAPVAETIVAAATGNAADLSERSADEVAADPLAAAMANIFSQCARPGLRTQMTPALAVTRVVWEILNGRGAALPGLDDELAQRSRTVGAQVAAASGTARAELLQSIGWALTSRIAGGLSLAAMAGATIQTGGLYRQLLSNPLLLGFPRGTLDRNPGDAAAVLGLSLDPALVLAGQKAAGALLTASRARLEAGKAEPLDVALQSVVPADADPESVGLHPTAGPALVAALPTLSNAKELQAAGVDKRFAKGLVSTRGARAMASAWKTLCEGLGTWDVFSSLVARVVPLVEQDGRVVGPMGPLPTDARWPLLVPRANASGTVQAVVAVRLTEARESLLSGLHARAWSLQNLGRAFDELARSNGATVRQMVGDCAVCTFPAPEFALRFASIVRKALGPEAGLELGEDSTTIPIPPTSALGVGLALGVVEGGTDGEVSHLSGRGIAEAIALAGNGRAMRLHDDGVGVREAGWGGGGLQNESIVASEAFVGSMMERTKRRNRPVHVRGEGGSCGGVSDDFTLAPVAGWWEADEGLVAAALLLDKESMEGASELRILSVDDFKEWFASDRSAAALLKPARPTASGRSASPVSTGGGFGGSSGYEDDYDGGGLDAPSMSFMDGGGSTLRAPASSAPVADEPDTNENTGDPDTADGFLMPSDDMDDSDYGFVADDQPEESDVGAFSLQEPSSGGSSRGPAPPMMLMDDEEPASGAAPAVAPPMMLDPEPASGPSGPAAPMMLEDEPPAVAPPMMLEDEPSVPAPPMMLEDDDEPVGGLLGDVQGSDPFSAAEDSSTAGLEPADSAFGPGIGSDRVGGASLLHSTYQGEMELVGMAGFSLAGDETAAGNDPFRDADEDTGFYDDRVSQNPRRVGGASTQPEPETRPVDRAMVRELVRLLRGYVVVRDGSNHTFGLPDSGLLRDAWSHEGSEHEAYVSFLRGKVADGFIPRADRVVALVPGANPEPIDSAAIEAAAGEAGL